MSDKSDNRPKVIKIWDKVYGCYIYISYGCSMKELSKQTLKYMGKESSQGCGPATDGMSQVFTTKDNRSCYWAWTEKRVPEVLIHELTHIAFRVLDDRGINLHGHNTEPLCYYLAFIFDEFLKQNGGIK